MRQARVEAQENLTTEPLPSKTAGISWMLGIMSLPLLFFPPAGVITGLMAIIFGHVAKFKIRKYPEVAGDGVATIGLLLGYMCFVGGLTLLPTIRMQTKVVDGIVNSYSGKTIGQPGSGLEAAEQDLLSTSTPSDGNGDDGRKIAGDVYTALTKLRGDSFNGPSPMEVQVHAQVKPGKGVCVLVVVPDMMDFDDMAREAMLNQIWKESQRAAFGKCQPGEEFVVAVRDRIRYQSMEFGRATKSPDRIAQPDSSFIDGTMLDPFFTESSEDAEAEAE